MVTSYVTRASKNPRLRAAWIFCALAWLAFSASAFPAGLSFAGVPLTLGGTVQANVPLSDLEKSYVSEGGNPVPSHAVAVLAAPPGLDPKSIKYLEAGWPTWGTALAGGQGDAALVWEGKRAEWAVAGFVRGFYNRCANCENSNAARK